jgi:ABC-type enterobactin transport system permease subunit
MQFGLYAAAIASLDYIRIILLYGLVTMRGTGRERLRLLGTGVLVVCAAFEAWWIATVDMQVPRDGQGVIMVSSAY